MEKGTQDVLYDNYDAGCGLYRFSRADKKHKGNTTNLNANKTPFS